MPEIGVSLCMTVKNEAHVLDRLAVDLRAQTVEAGRDRGDGWRFDGRDGGAAAGGVG